MKRFLSIGGAIVAVVVIGIQFVPVDRNNPPVDSSLSIAGPPDVLAVVRESCYDCHSHETQWPFYAYIAPISWLVAHDVEEGRAELNFSTWNWLSAEDQAEMREEIWEEVEEGEMPLPIYLLMHPGARPTDEDRAILRAWARGADDSDDE